MDNELRVATPQGTLQGTYYKSALNGNIYSAFFGIPYAEAPIENLRFKPPVPFLKWNGILKATKDRDECMQYSFLANIVVGSEDCLYLNVFTPKPPREIKQPKAVIVHIHFGGNYWGSGTTRGCGCPDFIVHHDVIYVVMTYRIHVFGFLNLNLPECAGNMGLKDQVMALKWVQQNIKFFGGDPNNVTLYGSSSGASAIHYHMMSPMSRGLFHKVIMISGYGLSPSWSTAEDPIGTAFEFGRTLGFKGHTTEELYVFLRQKSGRDLVVAFGELRAAQKKRNWARAYISPFLPSTEMFEDGAFLTHSPADLLYETVSVPMLCSLCEVEGITMLITDPGEKADVLGLQEIIKKNLWLFKMNDETLKYVTDQIQSFYFGSETKYSKHFNKLLELHSDMSTCEWQNMIDFQSRKANLYAYLFKYEGELNSQKNVFFPQYRHKVKGTFHGDDASYFLHSKYTNTPFEAKDKIVITNMATLLTNFAKSGNPSHRRIKWRPHTAENPCYLDFDTKLKVVDGIINERRTNFWRGLMEYIRKNEKYAD